MAIDRYVITASAPVRICDCGGWTDTWFAGHGRVFHIDNRMISKIARAAGAPNDKVAGVRLLCERGDKVRRGDPLFEIHSDSETKMDFAIKALEGWAGVELEKSVLSRIN